jgi:hypothetical protein
MPVTKLPFTNGFYKSDSLPLSAQECVNWYVNNPQAPALNESSLFRTPGISQLATSGMLATDVNRGAWVMNNKPYFVNGTKLYRLESAFTLTDLGTIAGTGRVSMADNGTQLFIQVPGGNGYIFTESTDTLTQITDGDFTANGNPQYVVFIDGYFVLTTDSKKFITSALNDGLSYTATDFGSAEANPDDIVAPFVFRNQLFIAGTETVEAFNNIGGAGFPFQRSGLYLSKGVSAPLSFAFANNTFMWIGGGKNEGPAIWQFAGADVQKVSTTAIDNLLQDLTDNDLTEVAAWSYAEKGAYFVGFKLPGTTIVFDTITGVWHERKSRIETSSGVFSQIKHRVQNVVSAYGRTIVADAFDGRVGEYSTDILDEYSENIVRTVVTQPFQNNMQEFFVPWIEMTVESGAGNETVENPVITMDISIDGGKTFRTPRARPIGKIGEYKKRAIWRRCGRMARFACFRFTYSEKADTSLLQLTADVR